jgi:hypothetical protein
VNLSRYLYNKVGENTYMSNKPDDRVTVGVDIPSDLVTRVKLDAVRRGVPMREVICGAIAAYIPTALKVVTIDESSTKKQRVTG